MTNSGPRDPRTKVKPTDSPTYSKHESGTTTISESPHIQFRLVTMLLTLVTAVNNRGHSTLQKQPPSHEEEGYCAPLETSQPYSNIVTNAIATILVRNTEVVAAVTDNKTSPSAVQTSGHLEQPPSIWRVFALQEDRDLNDPIVTPQDQLPPAGFVTLANPILLDDYFTNTPDKLFLAVKAGQSHWPSIVTNSWSASLNLKEPDSLPNHIATVEEYLNQFQLLEGDPANQTDLFRKFTHYIVVSCREKMIRRINHWSSRGFICTLGSIGDPFVLESYMTFEATIKKQLSKRKDSALGKTLRDMQGDEVSRVMQWYPRRIEDDAKKDIQLTNLQASFKAMLDSKLEAANVYNQDTCVEFHHLLIAVLIGYGNALAQFQESCGGKRKEKKREETELLQRQAEKVWFFAHLLWRISYSRVLRYHLAALEAGGFLSLPHDEAPLRKKYDAYTRYGKKETNIVVDEDEEESRCLIESSQHRPNISVALTFQRWMRIQASQFAALDILSCFVLRHRGSPVKISHMAVRSDKVESLPAGNWETIVRKLSQTPNQTFDPDFVIQVLKNRSKNRKWLEPFGVKAPSILYKFIPDTIELAGTIHCEIAMACLTKYHGWLANVDNGDSDSPVKNLDPCSISVSKLCCPICWELLTILRPDTFNVRGRHSTLTPVELPVWLPIPIVQQMLDRFTGYLREEIIKMVTMEMEDSESTRSPGHLRHPSDSGQSDSLSVSSDDSDRFHIGEGARLLLE